MAPEAEIIMNKNNDGFAKGNNDGVKRALKQDFDYIILFNMDTVAERDCVQQNGCLGGIGAWVRSRAG